jgi:hypothetical protein
VGLILGLFGSFWDESGVGDFFSDPRFFPSLDSRAAGLCFFPLAGTSLREKSSRKSSRKSLLSLALASITCLYQLASISSHLSPRIYQLASTSSHLSTRLYRLASVSSPLSTRLYQLASISSHLSPRIYQLASTSSHLSTRLYQLASINSPLSTRLYQLASITRIYHSPLSTRLYQLASIRVLKVFTTRNTGGGRKSSRRQRIVSKSK